MSRHILSLTVSILESVTRYDFQKICVGKLCSFRRKMGSVCGKNVVPISSKSSIMDDSSDFVEDVVCQDSDIKENEMKIFEIQDAGKVLLVRQNGKLSALGTKCTHYGAPLDKAALGEGRIRCQWHGACFNVMTGDIEDFPGLDSLPCYQVSVENNNVKVRARKSELTTNKRIKLMHKRVHKEDTRIVVIGGGPSGANCVENLRQEGFTGKITLVCKESVLPYDRVKVSKALDIDVAKLQFRLPQFYKEHDIDVMLDMEATKIDTENKIVTLSSCKTLEYDRLYIATGSKARKLDIPGADLCNVCVLRDHTDSKQIYSLLSPEIDIVILGVSFIGMEAASYCVDKVKSVTVIGRDSVPFKPQFGQAIGERFMKLFEEKGVKFIMNSGIKECVGDGSKLASVVLNDDSTLKADLLIMGVGSTFYTDFLKDSGIELNKDGSVPVDEHMETNVKGIYAGGDIAHAPVHVSDNEKASIGHYGLAHYHGKIAALNMLGKPTPVKAVPFFWTQLFGKSIRYAGHGPYDDIQIYGDLSELKFVAYFYKGDKVIAMAACQRDPVVSKFAEMLHQGKRLYRNDVESENFDWKHN